MWARNLNTTILQIKVSIMKVTRKYNILKIYLHDALPSS